LRKYISIAIAGATLIGVLLGLWEGLHHFLALLSAASPEVAAAIIGGMFTAFVGIIAAVLSHRYARVRASEDAHRNKKVEVYHGFLEVVARLMANANSSVHLKPLKEPELVKFLVKFKTDIMLWGSPSVLNAMHEFNLQSQIGDVKMFHAVDTLYRAIRNDIGLSNRGLKPYALVNMYLKDPGELDAMITANNLLKQTPKPLRGSDAA